VKATERFLDRVEPRTLDDYLAVELLHNSRSSSAVTSAPSASALHPEPLLESSGHPRRLLPKLLVRKGASAELRSCRGRGVPFDRALDQRGKRLRLPPIRPQTVALDNTGGSERHRLTVVFLARE
jgi:hypothetical protein